MTDRLTAAQIAEIEARAMAATPGPWTAGGVTKDRFVLPGGDSEGIFELGDVYILPPLGEIGPVAIAAGADLSAFISHARTDIPALVRDLRAAREDVAAVREAMLALADAAHAAGNVLFNLKQDAGPGAALTADARESCRAAQEGIDTAHARVQRAYAQTNQRAARAALPEETPNG